MSQPSMRLFFMATPLLSMMIAGCQRGPGRVEPPDIDPSNAAAQAMEDYDADGDGFIAGEELDATPPLKASMETVDANKDGKVEESEISERILTWQENRTGITSMRCYVTMNGQPIDGATVTFDPEPFLGPNIKAATGKTSIDGSVSPRIPKEQRPTPDTPPGIQLGFFRIRVTRGGSIPSKYNTETILGQQIAPDDPEVLKQRIDIRLSSD